MLVRKSFLLLTRVLTFLVQATLFFLDLRSLGLDFGKLFAGLLPQHLEVLRLLSALRFELTLIALQVIPLLHIL